MSPTPCMWRYCFFRVEHHTLPRVKIIPISTRRMISTSSALSYRNTICRHARYRPTTHHVPPTSKPPPPRSTQPPNTSSSDEILTIRKILSQKSRTWRLISLLIMGIPITIFTAWVTTVVISLYRDTSTSTLTTPLSHDTDVSDRYDLIAPNFDSRVNIDETAMGITKLREKLAKLARGDVLEVSIGTGRNLTYYDWAFQDPPTHRPGTGPPPKPKIGKVTSFTAVDKSAAMLEIAHEKFSTEYPGILGVRWIVQDATTTPFPNPPVSANERSGNKVGKKYDTIIQTMGICSTPNPTALLRNMAASLEPNGKILLLEHGRSTWDFVNWMLDKAAPAHAHRFGCWWNKDVEGIVRGAGLEVLELKRKHLGTTVWVVLGRVGDVHVEEKLGPARGWGEFLGRLFG